MLRPAWLCGDAVIGDVTFLPAALCANTIMFARASCLDGMPSFDVVMSMLQQVANNRMYEFRRVG
jgi:hypothetical protein